jgi:hypothetical protein
MGAGMFSEGEGSNNERGLSALPLPLVSLLAKENMSVIRTFKLLLIFGSFCYVFLPILLPRSHSSGKGLKARSAIMTGSLRALRIETWLTSSQIWNIPATNNVALTAVSTLVVLWKVLVSYIIGIDGMALFTRYSVDDTLTPFRAIDSQLSGGDICATKLRVLYTFLASFLCRPTARLQMVHALQVEVLLHDYLPSKYSNIISRYFWVKARESTKDIPLGDALDEIPLHLLNLLKCDDVFHHETVQRVYNSCFGLPSSHACYIGVEDVGFESVSKDERLNSVLSLVGSWHTSRLLQEVLVEYVENGTVDNKKLDVSKSIAPKGSRVQIRVAAIRCLLLESEGSLPLLEAMGLIGKELQIPYLTNSDKSSHPADISEDSEENVDDIVVQESDLDTTSSVSNGEVAYSTQGLVCEGERIPQDCRLAVHCSILLHYLSKSPKQAQAVLSRLPVAELDLLSFIAVWKVLDRLKVAHLGINDSKLESLAASARIWIGSEEAELQTLSLARRRELVGECIKLGTFFGGIELDEGYGSE